MSYGMATQDRDPGFVPAERKDPVETTGYPSLRVPRRLPWAGIVTALTSALLGATVAWLVLTPEAEPELPPAQSLAALPSPTPSVHSRLDFSLDESQEVDEVSKDKNFGESRNPSRMPPRHTRIVFEPKGSHSGAAPPPPPPSGTTSGDSGSSSRKSDSGSGSKEAETETEPEFRWPRTRLYHLYRKRDKLHYYTITATDSEAAQSQNGFKERLSPGFVYTHNAYPKKLIPIQPYALIEPVYIFKADQGDATFPLYRLYKSGYKQMLTSWTHIRQAWLDKGWQDRGIAGYIYRP